MKLLSKNEIMYNISEAKFMTRNEKLNTILNTNKNLKVTFIIILVILFIILKLYIRNNYYDDENIKPDYHDIYGEQKFDSFIDAFNKSKI